MGDGMGVSMSVHVATGDLDLGLPQQDDDNNGRRRRRG